MLGKSRTIELKNTLALAMSRHLLYTTEKIQLAKKGTEDMTVFMVMPNPRPERANNGSSTSSMYLANII